MKNFYRQYFPHLSKSLFFSSNFIISCETQKEIDKWVDVIKLMEDWCNNPELEGDAKLLANSVLKWIRYLNK